ncbi:MAG: hypothetical protein GX957_08570 [Clostridiaceae bacterium]|nr:hypothetical protein [Clostridiaceae bacterium]
MNITEDIKKVVQSFEDKQDCTKCLEYENAIKKHEQLVQAGFTKSRGNNLLPIEKKHSQNHQYL